MLFTACPDGKYSITICNNSNYDIWSTWGSLMSNPADTAIWGNKSGGLFKKGECVAIDFSYRYKAKDTLHYFIIDLDTLNTYSWEEIKEGYKILQRYDLGGRDIESLNYTIPYPPTEAMRDMKMYPPYGE